LINQSPTETDQYPIIVGGGVDETLQCAVLSRFCWVGSASIFILPSFISGYKK
jgi:hypothetical protein